MVDKGALLSYNNSCVPGNLDCFRGRFCEAGCGSAWLERLVWDQEAAGSNPVTPMSHKIKE